MFLGGCGFNISIRKYFSEEWEQIYQLSLKSRTREGKLAAIYLPQILYESAAFQSIFVISLFSCFMKLIVIHVERRFHVISYLTWKWFEFIIFFCSTIISLLEIIYTFPIT